MGTGHHHVLATKNQVHVAGTIDLRRTEIIFVIMSGIAADAEVIHQFAHLFRLALTPLEIRSIELDALVSELSDRAHGALRILLERVTNRIQFETNGNGCRRTSLERPRKHG